MVLRALIALPILGVLFSFAFSNPMPVRLGLWPTTYTVELPLSLAILGAAGFTFLLGTLAVWVGALRDRRRARHAEHAVRLLEEEVRMLKARLPDPVVLPHSP